MLSDQDSDCKHGNLAHDEIQNAKLIWIRENQNVLYGTRKSSIRN